ncbi:MAG: hypothetical protein ACI4ON_02500 [Clostridia bacterium]
MEERINLIKKNLTGNYNEDVEYLTTLYSAQSRVLEDTVATIEAINTVLEEITKEQEIAVEKEEITKEEIEEDNRVEEKAEDVKKEQELQEDTRTDEEKEIDDLIAELTSNIDNESDEEALASIEKIIPKIEAISKAEDENVIYCSFSSDFEKMIFENIFGGEKQVKDTPYANDVVYTLYSDLLLKKKKRKAAMDALDRAIYWNFLNREAREKKIDLYYSKQEIVKCLDTIKKLQMISYTAQDIASCYNKYAFIFNSLKDSKSAYALYRLSYSYYQDENVLKMITQIEETNPTYKDIPADDLINLAKENEVEIGPNANIIRAHRNITTKLIEAGAIQEAKLMIENDYAMTKDEAIAKIYNQLNELDNSVEENSNEEKEDHQEEKKVAKKTTKSTTKSVKKDETAKKEKKATTTKKTTKKATTKK